MGKERLRWATSVKRVHVLVEGQTEELFVREILKAALDNVVLNPVLISTKRVKAGGKFSGGLVSFAQVEDNLRRLLKDTSATAVTTLFDLYGLPTDFPGMTTALRGRQRAVHLESEIHLALGAPPRLIPHLSVHEFEAFLFVSPVRAPTVFNSQQQLQLCEVTKLYGGDVELINDGATTHPSARIKSIVAGYDKVHGGAIAVLEIGLDAILAACPHLKTWVDRLAAL